MNKHNDIHTCNGTLFSINMREILSHAMTEMNFEDIILSEINHLFLINFISYNRFIFTRKL